MRPFLVMEILERAQALEQAGRSVIHLEVGEPDFDTPARVIDASREALASGDTRYTHSLGIPELREAISRRYQRVYGVDVAPERILVTAGSSMAMLYTFAALIREGDEVIAAAPHYPCYPNFIGFFGGRLVGSPTDPADGYRLDPARVRRIITPRTRAILLNSPANPTGAVLDLDHLRALTELGPILLSDEIYHGLTYGVRAPSVLEVTDHAYVFDGFSKRYAMTGWRLGWVVTPPDGIRTLQVLQQSFMISANPFVQRGGIEAINSGDADTERMCATYDRRRHIMVDMLRGLGFGIPVMPEGAFYVYADASRFTHDSLAFAVEILERTGVGVTPGIDFGECGRCSLRFSYAASEDDIREAGRRLETFLAEQ